MLSRSSLSRHKKENCRMARAGKAEVNRILARAAEKDEVIASKDAAIASKDAVIADQKRALAEVDKIRKELEAMKTQMAAQAAGGGGGRPAIVNNTVNNTQINNHITINSFGNEDIAHLKGGIQSLLASGRAAHEVIEELGKMIWCDRDHPENGTLYNPNVKDSRVCTRRADGRWETRDRNVVHRQAHSKLTDHAYNNQPRSEKGALAADPILKEMDAIDKGEATFPTGVYNAITEGARVHAHTRGCIC